MSLSSFLYKGADQDLLKKDLTDVFGLTKTSAEVEKPYAELDAPEGTIKKKVDNDSEEQDREEKSGSESGATNSRKRKAESDPEDAKSAKRRKREKEKEIIKVNPDSK